MKTKTIFLSLPIVWIAFPNPSFAQDIDSEEIFSLSPFALTSGRDAGYASSAKSHGPLVQELTLSADTVVDGFLRALPGGDPQVPVVLVKPADELSVRFAVSFYDDIESVRRERLLDYLEKVEKAVSQIESLRFEAGALLVAEGNRKKSLRKRKSEYASHAHFAVFADLREGESTYEQIRAIRELVGEAVSESEVTKLFDGSANLVLRRPDTFRSELLAAIFADQRVLREGLGSEFEILPNGLDHPVHARVHSDREIEVWIKYGFRIRSIRELEFEKTKLLP